MRRRQLDDIAGRLSRAAGAGGGMIMPIGQLIMAQVAGPSGWGG